MLDLYASPEPVKDVVRLATLCGAQVSIVMVYAVFNTIFSNLSPMYQPMFALFIPAFKMMQKNILSRILAGRDDTKPQVVILNVEIFNALFISNCMQNAQSMGTSITLISVDIPEAAFVMSCDIIDEASEHKGMDEDTTKQRLVAGKKVELSVTLFWNLLGLLETFSQVH
ncbi:hypothetical protein P3T76_010474 [Phytophthora citrophthora]|uniref:Uncharacterized protein n=1 Tax=Phytophthora citrophthora TaxID=4793 RepID=A0AAD9GCD1_9STRA|nr:hypothetical protein P3T76_010474 [Phytophthora citrophthora]